jgi:hypothetical protein
MTEPFTVKTPSAATKQKMKESALARAHKIPTKPQRAVYGSEEHKRKLSAAAIRRYEDPEQRKRKPRSEAHKRKLSEAGVRRFEDPDQRRKASETTTRYYAGKPHTSQD